MDKFLRQELDVCLGNSYFWVDSQLVLRYICNETRRFQVFVGNRVSVIREFSDPAQWSHVPGKENPADLITRNQDHNSLDRDRWLHGPKFLRTHKSEWQSIKVELDLSGDDPEVKKEVKSHASAIVSSPVLHIDKLLQHYSSWIKLKKAVAWLLRYKDFLRGHRKFEGYLTAKELKEAEVNILRHVQSSNYGKECKSLLKDESVGKDSSIRSLTPVMGEDGLIRVGGRSDEMFETVLSEVEAVINGRPITKVSDDPKDENALTPNHLLLLGSGCSFPPGVFCSNDMYRRKWKFVQHLVNCFWKRWIESYVPELQRRAKWLLPQRNFIVGDLVLIADESTPKNVWPMGLIIDTNVGNDGLVRSVKLKTKSTTLVRPIHKLVLLEGAT